MLRHTVNLMLGLCSLTLTTLLFANDGGMTGGGAGLVLDRNNPWFLDNTKEVRYCVEIAPEQFSAPIELVDKSINAALLYWKNEYANAFSPVFTTEMRPVKIATQKFFRVPCSEPYDMTIQFGVLHEKQRADIPKPEEFAGAAIRTSYDPIKMRGKGYIYIAADRGALRFKGAPKNIADFWSYGQGGLLFRTLVHELGHVFGLTHHDDSVMSERAIEEMMTEAIDYYASFYDPMPFFKFSARSKWNVASGSNIISLPKKTVDFFGIDADMRAILFVQDVPGQLVVKTFKDQNHNWVKSGTIYLEMPDARNYKSGQNIYLPDGNEVYKLPSDELHIKTLPGPQIEEELRSGVYVSVDNKIKRQIVVTLKPSGPGLMMGGIVNGKIDMNVLDVHFYGETRDCPFRALGNFLRDQCVRFYDPN